MDSQKHDDARPLVCGCSSALDSPEVLLEELRHLGVQLVAQDGQLRFRPRHIVPTDLLERIRRHKAALLALLLGKPQSRVVPTPSETRLGTYSPSEERILAGCPPELRTTINTLKGAFIDMNLRVTSVRDAVPAVKSSVLH